MCVRANGEEVRRQTRTSIRCCANKVVGVDAEVTTPIAVLVSIQVSALVSAPFGSRSVIAPSCSSPGGLESLQLVHP